MDETKLHPPPPGVIPVDDAKIARAVAAFLEEVAGDEAWDSDFVPSPYEPHTAMDELIALGPVVVPSLCALVEKGPRGVRYWAIVGLMELGSQAGAPALVSLESVVDDPKVGDHAARAIAFVDEARYFALGLHRRTEVVRRVASQRAPRGTAAGWLEAVFAAGDESASVAAIDGLGGAGTLDAETLAVLRNSLWNPSAVVRGKAAALLESMSELVPSEVVVRAMLDSGRIGSIDRVAACPDSIELVDELIRQKNIGLLADLVRRRRCAGLATPSVSLCSFVEHKLRRPTRRWRFEQHDVHDAATCALELGDASLVDALVAAIVPENGGYAWAPLVRALAYFPGALARVEQRLAVEVDTTVAERLGWMRDELASFTRPAIATADEQFVAGNIDHPTAGAFQSYAAFLRYQPTAHAAFQLAWIDRAFGVRITNERIAWIRRLGCTDDALLEALVTPVRPLSGFRSAWRHCQPADAPLVVAAGLYGLAFTGSKDPAHKQLAEHHLALVRDACGG